jgi:hypothetical protein
MSAQDASRFKGVTCAFFFKSIPIFIEVDHICYYFHVCIFNYFILNFYLFSHLIGANCTRFSQNGDSSIHSGHYLTLNFFEFGNGVNFFKFFLKMIEG